MKTFVSLIRHSLHITTHGNRHYHAWMALLTFLILTGIYCYSIQVKEGLHVTGMTDRVSWGLYISNFTFLVGVAAAAVMLVLPAYILKDIDFSQAVLIGEGLAVAALLMCLAFVVADMGGPAVVWHMLPWVGILNFPDSMLAWDLIVLNGYLFINITIPLYILYTRYKGQTPKPGIYVPGVMISVFWAIGIHLVTAFLYQGLPARPFWNNALLGPRFLASAFSAGPALIILTLAFINRWTDFKVSDKTIAKIALIVTVAAQINLIMLLSELFKEFYFPTHHSQSATYLFFGLNGHDALTPWIRLAIGINIIATLILTYNSWRSKKTLLYMACGLLFIGIWVEKGLGLIVPGFIPGPYGRIAEYLPTPIEIGVTVGIWAMGMFIFTILARVGIAIETGKLRYQKAG